MTAQWLVNVFFTKDNKIVILAETVAVLGWGSAFHAYSVHFLHVFGDGHKGRNGAERFPEEVHIQTGYDHSDAIVGELRRHIDQRVVKELCFVDSHHLNAVFKAFEHLGGFLDGGALYAVEIVGYNLVFRVTDVYAGFVDANLLVGELGSAQTPYQLFGLAGEHTAANHFD